jgi:hypothetical protein
MGYIDEKLGKARKSTVINRKRMAKPSLKRYVRQSRPKHKG